MGDTDIASRKHAELMPAEVLRGLFGQRFELLGRESTEKIVVERRLDNVLRMPVDGVETIVELEFQASHSDEFVRRFRVYHAMLLYQFEQLPVRSMVVYLMHEAPPHPVPRSLPAGPQPSQVQFTYDVYCAWEHPITPEDVRREPALAPLVE